MCANCDALVAELSGKPAKPKQKIVVSFTYDEDTRLWDPVVHGTHDPIEARQAFSAVVITCQQLNAKLLSYAMSDGIAEKQYRIIPAVQ